jgi:hypothetical protein
MQRMLWKKYINTNGHYCPFSTSELTSFHHGYLLVAIPTILLGSFVAVPLIYAFLNYLSGPQLTSIDNLQDEYSLHHPYYLNNTVCSKNEKEHSTRYGRTLYNRSFLGGCFLFLSSLLFNIILDKKFWISVTLMFLLSMN